MKQSRKVYGTVCVADPQMAQKWRLRLVALAILLSLGYSGILYACGALVYNQRAQGPIEPGDPGQYILTVSGYETMGTNMGNHCATSLSAGMPIGDVISVEFLDAATGEPFAGFGPWVPSASAANAAEQEDPAEPGTQWFGFCSEVVGFIPEGKEGLFRWVVTSTSSGQAVCNAITDDGKMATGGVNSDCSEYIHHFSSDNVTCTGVE